MTIIRDGKEITLTQEELNQAWQEAEQIRLRSIVEGEIESECYLFDNYEDLGYESVQDCREDFIEACLEGIQDQLEEVGGGYDHLISQIVAGQAENFELEQDF